MRAAAFSIAMALTCASTAPAFALQADDGMMAWKKATDAERSELLEALLGKDQASSAKITACMNETSVVPGHADVSISEVAKACASNAGEPV